MLDSIVNAISKFIEWFRAPFKTLVAAWIVLALVLRGWIHTFIAAAFWFCTAFIVLYCVEYIGRRLAILRHLHQLSGDERRVLHSFIKWDSRTNGFISGAPTAYSLARMKILEPSEASNPNHYARRRGDSFFSISPWIFSYLKKRPHLIRAEEFSVSPPPRNASWPEMRDWLERTNGGRIGLKKNDDSTSEG